jgi:hypothetical protein
MKYAFIKENRQCFPVQLYCELFSVSRSGYYGWLNRSNSQRALSTRALNEKILRLYKEH